MILKELLLGAALAAVGAQAYYSNLEAITPTAADPCGTQSSSGNLYIATTAERDLAAECTELNHYLYIDSDYPSILSLPKLTSVLGFRLHDDTSSSRTSLADGLLTGLSFPNLVNASEIYVSYLKNIATIDVPKLAYNGDDLRLEGLPALESYNGFESIRSTERVEISGTGLRDINYSSLEKVLFMSIEANPSLTNVDLSAANIRLLSVDCVNNPLPRFSGPANANQIHVTGCGTPPGDPRTAFGVKKMIGESVGPDDGSPLLDKTFHFSSNSFSSIGFPNLTHVDGELSLNNNDDLSDFVFPALRTVNGTLSFSGWGYSDIIINQTTFPALVNVSDLRFYGGISDFTLPDSLLNASVIISSTNSDLNCSKFADHAVTTTDPTKTGIQISCTAPTKRNNGGSSGGGGVSGDSWGGSSSSSHSSGPRLSAGTIAGIVIGSVSSLASVCVIAWLCLGRQKNKVQSQENMQAHHYSANQVPPPLRNAPSGAYVGKPEQGAVNAQVLPYVGPGVHHTTQAPSMSREADLDARQRALEARERNLAEREARTETGGMS
ncbi:hypothetical protein V492_01771 [Pseudogymnoascus sp. VKM F-4246]|nr:hypothetical protein V492_01771 [Pseudogymnoascus sp. VKM F-4246]